MAALPLVVAVVVVGLLLLLVISASAFREYADTTCFSPMDDKKICGRVEAWGGGGKRRGGAATLIFH